MKIRFFAKRPQRTQLTLLLLLLAFVIQCEFSACYKTEIEITPAPPEEVTTKKSGGWFSGWFKGSDSSSKEATTATPTRATSTTTTTPKPGAARAGNAPAAVQPPIAGVAQKPPPLVIPHAPLMPLGPRPDTPLSSPFGSATNPQQQPQWPSAGTTSTTRIPPQQHQPQHHGVQQQNIPGARPGVNGGAPNLPPGFAPLHPPKAQPSGFDLSYGGGGHAQPGARPGAGLAPIGTTTTTTTTIKPAVPPLKPSTPPAGANIDLRFDGPSSTTTTTKRPQTPKDDFPALPPPRRPSIKEDFPALPTPKAPASPTPASSPLRPSSPSAWNTPAAPAAGDAHKPLIAPTTAKPAANGAHGAHGVSFVPHTPSGTTSTVRPGFSANAGNSLATDDEIRQLTEQLYTKETNSQLNLINVNLQGKTRSIDSADEAPQPLLTVDPKALESSTIAKLQLLFNNYEENTLVNEHVTPNERKEENDFLDAVMATGVMRQAMSFLQQKGVVTPDPKTHRDLVKELWFTQYSRGQGKIGSSGFEHVFVHEVKNGTIIGFHNWVYVNEEEKAGRFDYKGYLKNLDIGTKGKVLKIRFTHNGLNKPVDTMFVGTSPELELALYTLCFQLRPDRTCPVQLGNSKFGIITYSWRYRGKNLIGSAYPEI